MKRNTIRQIYLYAVSLVSLFLLIFAASQLVNLGLKTWVLTKADTSYNQKCDESGNVYYGARPMPVSSIEKPTAPTTVQPTAEEKAAAKAECERNLADQRSAAQQNQLVSALSMLIVALPIFAFHFRLVQKERRDEKEEEEKKS